MDIYPAAMFLMSWAISGIYLLIFFMRHLIKDVQGAERAMILSVLFFMLSQMHWEAT